VSDEPAVRTCAYDVCGIKFLAVAHNQRYHSSECLRLATNKRLMEQYYAKAARRKGHIRECGTEGCKTKLSRYNDSEVCAKCEAAEDQRGRNSIMEFLDGK
jgi:hypothetical protein